jgi:hypothetical protein
MFICCALVGEIKDSVEGILAPQDGFSSMTFVNYIVA